MAYADEGYTDFAPENMNWDEEGVPIAIGQYDVELAVANVTTTKTDNKPMVSVQFKVFACDNPEHEKEIDKILFDNFVFAPGKAFRVKAFGKAAGLELPTRIDPKTLHEWAETVLGTRITVTVGHRPDQNGELRAQIKKMVPLGSDPNATAEHSEKESPKAKTNGAAKHGGAATPPVKGATSAKGRPQVRR